MRGRNEGERSRFKTELVVLRHHLDWSGLQPGQSFVDFACASGEPPREAARIAAPAECVGVDGDPEMIAFAKPASDREGLTNVRYIHSRIAGGGSTPLPSGCFDHA